MNLLDLPTEVLRHILSYNVLPYARRVCKELDDIEMSLLQERRDLTLNRYRTIRSLMVAGIDMLSFVMDYMRDFLTNHGTSRSIRLADTNLLLGSLVQLKRRDIALELIDIYSTSLSIEDARCVSRICTYDTLSKIYENNGLCLSQCPDDKFGNYILEACLYGNANFYSRSLEVLGLDRVCSMLCRVVKKSKVATLLMNDNLLNDTFYEHMCLYFVKEERIQTLIREKSGITIQGVINKYVDGEDTSVLIDLISKVPSRERDIIQTCIDRNKLHHLYTIVKTTHHRIDPLILIDALHKRMN